MPGNDASMLLLITVSAKGRKLPTYQEPLIWFLLCSEGETDPASTTRIAGWYGRRWTIEESSQVIKSGYQVEKRQFDETENMLMRVAFDAITA